MASWLDWLLGQPLKEDPRSVPAPDGVLYPRSPDGLPDPAALSGTPMAAIPERRSPSLLEIVGALGTPTDQPFQPDQPATAAGPEPPATAASPAGPIVNGEADTPRRRRDYYAEWETGGVSGDPYQAGNGRGSGAFGRYQFTPNFYADLRARYPQEGLGSWEDFKATPAMQDKAMDLADRYYRERAERAGIPYVPVAGRAMHFMGADGGLDFLQRFREDPTASAPDWVQQTYGARAGQVVAQNPGVFTDEQGNPRTLGDVFARLNGTPTGALSGAPGAPGASGEAAGPAGAPHVPGQPTPQQQELLDRLLSRLDNRQANREPLWGQLAGAIGSGLLAGHNWQTGLAAASQNVNKTLDQRERNRMAVEDRELATLGGLVGRPGAGGMNGPGALSNRPGASVNIGFWKPDGTRDSRMGITIGGRAYFEQPDGTLRSVAEELGTTNYWIESRGSSPDAEGGWNGILGAYAGVMDDHGNPIPFFRQNSDQAKAYAMATSGLAARQKLAQMEDSGYDPTRAATALENYFTNSDGLGRKSSEMLSRMTGLTSPEDREYARQMLLFAESVARVRSGAAINEQEFARFRTMFTAGVGGVLGNTEAARKARDDALVPMFSMTGPAAQYLSNVALGRLRLPDLAPRILDERAYSDERPEGSGGSGAPQGGSGGGQDRPAEAPQSGRGTQENPIVLQAGQPIPRPDPALYYKTPRGQVVTGAVLIEAMQRQRQPR